MKAHYIVNALLLEVFPDEADPAAWEAFATYGVRPMSRQRIVNMSGNRPTRGNEPFCYYGPAIHNLILSPWRDRHEEVRNDDLATSILVRAVVEGAGKDQLDEIVEDAFASAGDDWAYFVELTKWLLASLAKPKIAGLFNASQARQNARTCLEFLAKVHVQYPHWKKDLVQVARLAEAAGMEDIITPEVTAEML